MNDLVARYTSRKFLLTLAAAIFAIIQLQAGAITPQEAMAAIGAVVSVFVGIEGVGDAAARQGENSTVIAAQPASPKARALFGK